MFRFNPRSKYFKMFICFVIMIALFSNFLYITSYKAEAFSLVSGGIALRLFMTLLTAAGVSFIALDSISLNEIYDSFINLYPSFGLELATAAYSSVLSGAKASIEDGIWSKIKEFVSNYFDTGIQSGITIDVDSGEIEGVIGEVSGLSGDKFTMNESNTLNFEIMYGNFKPVFYSRIFANKIRAINGYYLDSDDCLISPSGEILVDPELDFGGYYNEVAWSFNFDPNDMYECDVTVAWWGAIGRIIGSVPVIDYGNDYFTISNVGVLEKEVPLPIPVNYFGNDILYDVDYKNDHDFKDDEGKREIGFPWLGSKKNIDTYDGTADDLLEELDNDVDLELDIGRIISVNYDDIVNTGVDCISEGELGQVNVSSNFAPTTTEYGIPGDGEVPGTSVPTGFFETITETISDVKDNIINLVVNISVFFEDIFEIGDDVEFDFNPLITLGLKDKFPFCIPWDIKNSVAALNVVGEAPKWDIDFKEISFSIDFSMFEEWAKIIRWGVLIIFNFGLIKSTRNLIRG